MTNLPKKYEIGYGRPPKHTRWKKGQCGNPNRIRNRSPKPAVQMIDEFFASKIDIIEKDISRPVTAFEAILLQLWIKTMGGSKREGLAEVPGVRGSSWRYGRCGG